MSSPKFSSFSPDRLLADIKHVCQVVGASYSEEMTKRIIEVYATSFHRAAVLWRVTDRPGDAVNYRFYERERTDTIQLAIDAKLLDSQNPMIPIFQSWSRLFEGAPIQLCDFDAEKGIVKAWLYLSGYRQLDDILDAPGVPDTIRHHRKTFHSLNLTILRYVAVDYHAHTINLYFRAPGPLSFEAAANYVALAGSPPPLWEDYKEMVSFLNPDGFAFGVTIDCNTGFIGRVAIYAIKLPTGKSPVLGQRLAQFFQEAPSYDKEDFNAVAWSYGKSGKSYMKAERSYSGELIQLLTSWRSDLSS
ncbi:prenyltransferase-like protein [Mariannaea sp. PMI_226]|nr:prenyltransferase-like protein [Mariannaea sp. PMI_226]